MKYKFSADWPNNDVYIDTTVHCIKRVRTLIKDCCGMPLSVSVYLKNDDCETIYEKRAYGSIEIDRLDEIEKVYGVCPKCKHRKG